MVSWEHQSISIRGEVGARTIGLNNFVVRFRSLSDDDASGDENPAKRVNKNVNKNVYKNVIENVDKNVNREAVFNLLDFSNEILVLILKFCSQADLHLNVAQVKNLFKFFLLMFKQLFYM